MHRPGHAADRSGDHVAVGVVAEGGAVAGKEPIGGVVAGKEPIGGVVSHRVRRRVEARFEGKRLGRARDRPGGVAGEGSLVDRVVHRPVADLRQPVAGVVGVGDGPRRVRERDFLQVADGVVLVRRRLSVPVRDAGQAVQCVVCVGHGLERAVRVVVRVGQFGQVPGEIVVVLDGLAERVGPGLEAVVGVEGPRDGPGGGTVPADVERLRPVAVAVERVRDGAAACELGPGTAARRRRKCT